MNEAQRGPSLAAGTPGTEQRAFTPPAFPTAVELFDVESLLAILRKRFHVVLLAIVVCAALAAVKAFSEAPVFASSAKVQLGREPVDPRVYANQLYVEPGLSTEYVNTETMLLKSRNLAQVVIDRRPEVAQALEGVSDKAGALQGAVFVKPIAETYLIDVGCEGEDPKNCMVFANAVSEVYASFKDEKRKELMGTTLRMIEERFPEIQARITLAQKKLEEHNRKNDYPPGAKEVIVNRLRGLNEALSAVRLERLRADSAVESINQVRRDGRPIESAPPMEASTVLLALRTQLTNVEIELAELLERYKDRCPLPKVAALRTRRDQLKLEIQSQIALIEALLASRREEKYAEEKRLEKSIDDQNKQATLINQKEQEVVLLSTEIQDNQQLYEKLTQRVAELKIYSPFEGAAVTIIERAPVPGGPIRPNRPRMIAVGIALGLALGLFVTYLLELVDTRVRSADDVRAYIHSEVLGLVPDVPNVVTRELERLALTRSDSPFAESFRRLRAQIHASAPARVVLVTSGAPAEGKTAGSINLAVATANTGSRVVLIDADMRSPCIHKTFDLDLEPGLADCLTGERKPLDVIRETDVPNLYVLTSGRPPRNPAELLASTGAFMQLIAVIRSRFDRIVIDTPPASLLSDASIMAPAADTTVLIVSTKHSRRRATRLAYSSLVGVGVKPVGVILNNVSDAGLIDMYYYRGRGYLRPGDRTTPALEHRSAEKTS
ncbi:polysaccharide biosynthesis tyrosine autokinase [bacterium]|nr:polysaccharide biosynthesis tyrosine autokinase [bacterium]